jgi:hypothetical protein
VAPSTARTTTKRFQAASLGWPQPDGLTDAALEAVTGRADGTGLGLAIVREIARASG